MPHTPDTPPTFDHDEPIPPPLPVEPASLPMARPYAAVVVARAADPYLNPYLMPPRQAWVDIGLMLAALFWGIMLIGVTYFSGFLRPPPGYEIIVQPLMLGGVSLLTLCLILRFRRQDVRAVGLVTLGPARDFGLGVLSVFGAYFINMAFMGLTFWFAEPGEIERLASEKAPLFEAIGRTPAAWILPVTIFVGLYEELVVRGLLLSRLMVIFKSPPAPVLISSLLFGVMHYGSQGWLGVIQTFFIGLLFAGLAVWRRSLWPCVMGHTLLDAFGFFIAVAFRPAIQDALRSLQPA